MNNKKRSTLAGPAFLEQVTATADDIRTWCVPSLDEAASSLLEDWQGKVIGVIGLTLGPDNRDITSARLSLQGQIYDSSAKKIAATKFWKGLPTGMHILIKNFDCSLFTFSEGTVSGLVNHDQFEHEFRTRAGEIVDRGTLEELGIRGFSIKAYVWPTAPNWASLSVVLFPMEEADLVRTYPLAEDDRCPSILFFGEKIPFGPPAKIRWGMPFNPAILPGGPVEDDTEFPNGKELAKAMSLLLRKAKQPILKLNVTQLEKVLAHQAENGHNVSTLSANPLEIIWPDPSGDNSGRCNSFFNPSPPTKK